MRFGFPVVLRLLWNWYNIGLLRVVVGWTVVFWWVLSLVCAHLGTCGDGFSGVLRGDYFGGFDELEWWVADFGLFGCLVLGVVRDCGWLILAFWCCAMFAVSWVF